MDQEKIDQNNYIHFYDIKTNETIFGYTIEDYLKDNNDNVSEINKDSCISSMEVTEKFNDNISPINSDIDSIKYYTNNIVYSKNLFLKFKNKFLNILDIIPLNNYEIELLKKIFRFRNRNFINSVKIYYQDMSVYYGEITKKYERNGFGIMNYPNRDIFSINWQKNNAYGRGIYKYYIGSNSGNYQDTKISQRTNGRKYSNLLEIYCSLELEKDFNSTKLVGKWINNMFHGNNSIYYSNGDTYKGTTKYNMLSGYGIMYYYDGSTYEGYWHNNMHCIGGIITYPNGESYEYS